ncbi:hypothetical protein ABZW03_06230 [Kitasatospora sp. NPDC004799]|uniref:hypothetical protein n=1 Tax=Kitasatospora sp. NPDC004799 TaxID=3154460 RepID=UPI0033AB2EF5
MYGWCTRLWHSRFRARWWSRRQRSRNSPRLGHRRWTAHAIEDLGQAAERSGLPEVAASWYSANQDPYRDLGSTRDVQRLHARLLALPTR